MSRLVSKALEERLPIAAASGDFARPRLGGHEGISNIMSLWGSLYNYDIYIYRVIIYVNMYEYIYISISIYIYISLSLSIYIYIYIHTFSMI